MRFYPLAQTLSAAGAATVVTPDLRGHGFNPAQRGDEPASASLGMI
ncbi:MAG: hypothetical protein IPM76_18635 [Chloroflexi bacterium]|nr:hypothetical protein [Chloroflexota bacterium]